MTPTLRTSLVAILRIFFSDFFLYIPYIKCVYIHFLFFRPYFFLLERRFRISRAIRFSSARGKYVLRKNVVTLRDASSNLPRSLPFLRIFFSSFRVNTSPEYLKRSVANLIPILFSAAGVVNAAFFENDSGPESISVFSFPP